MRSKPYKAAVTASTGHVNFWRENIKWLQSWKIDSSHIQCVQGWILTLTVLILLWSELQDRWNFEFLLVSRCNQDCLENLFSVVRQKGGSNDTPRADQFRNSLKAAVVDRLLRPEGKNCQFLEEDNNDSVFIDYLLECTKKKSSDTPPSSHDHLPSSSVGPSSASPPPRSLEEENVLVYVAGYLCHRVLFKHRCSRCMSAMVRKEATLDNPNLLLTHFKAMEVEGSDFGLLKVPTHDFISFVAIADDSFKTHFHSSHHTVGLGNAIKNNIRSRTIQQQVSLGLCPSTLESVLSVFVRMRIHHCLKHLNKSLSATTRKNRKYLKVSHS